MRRGSLQSIGITTFHKADIRPATRLQLFTVSLVTWVKSHIYLSKNPIYLNKSLLYKYKSPIHPNNLLTIPQSLQNIANQTEAPQTRQEPNRQEHNHRVAPKACKNGFKAGENVSWNITQPSNRRTF